MLLWGDSAPRTSSVAPKLESSVRETDGVQVSGLGAGARKGSPVE
jgi:hypothetical protein